jgi:putative transposase
VEAIPSLDLLRSKVFSLFTREEVDADARLAGYTLRADRGLPPFEFVVASIMAAVSERCRSFATVWRVLVSVMGIRLARSAVTQRFDSGSAKLMELLFHRALARLSAPEHPELLGKLARFRQVLANDGSVVKLSPVLAKLFPATRTNSVQAAAKLHATVDLVHRRITGVVLTGERQSEIGVAEEAVIEPGTLIINDLGYFKHRYFAKIKDAKADLLSRLKENSNPVVTRVRHGVIAPVRSIGMKLNDLTLCRTQETCDFDALFEMEDGEVELRIVGLFNTTDGKYHFYVTTLPAEEWSAWDLYILYTLRWVIELFFKLMKSSLHLEHVRTGNADAMRTHLYASLLASVVLQATTEAAAAKAEIPVNRISPLVAGIAAPLLAVPLALLWLDKRISPQSLADLVLRTLFLGCVDQNPRRTHEYWKLLS